MKKTILYIICACLISATLYGQNGDTYQIKKLKKPRSPLRMQAPARFFGTMRDKEFMGFSHSDPLVRERVNPVISGFLRAYQEHRPITLSPDIVWLLICQGFGRHVAINAEELQQKFVNFNRRDTLKVVRKYDGTSLQRFPWETAFPELIEKVKGYVGEELPSIFTADFTTTTPVSLMASQITILDTIETYCRFKRTEIVEFKNTSVVNCGIPEVTIEGSLEDWQKIMEKLDVLEKYELRWWTKELRPVIGEIIKAKSGKFSKKFWEKMIRFQNTDSKGSFEDIDGWFLKFYPYLDNDNRSTMKSVKDISELPEEIVSIPFKYESWLDQDTPDKKLNMEFLVGFVGLSQDSLTYNLKPEIGWAACVVNKAYKRSWGRNASLGDVIIVPFSEQY